MNKLKELMTIAGMMSGMSSDFDYQTGRYRRDYSPTPCKKHQGVAHLVNQSKKLRKGSGHRKLTRAERKRNRI